LLCAFENCKGFSSGLRGLLGGGASLPKKAVNYFTRKTIRYYKIDVQVKKISKKIFYSKLMGKKVDGI